MEVSTGKTENVLTLKVMRLKGLSFFSPVIVTTDLKDLSGNTINNLLKNDVTTVTGAETITASDFLQLSQDFGDIYLGETLSCFICVHNLSNQIVRCVSLRVSLNSRNTNVDISNDSTNSKNLLPDGTIEELISHGVKELGSNILVCEVTYLSFGTNDLLTFRKFYKFDVLKPLDVKTKIYNIDAEIVYLEAQIQNITQDSVILNNVLLETSPLFQIENYELCNSKDYHDSDLLSPLDMKQFVFSIKPSPEANYNISKLSNTTYIGKLDITWKFNLLQNGRIQTTQLHKCAPQFDELYLCIEHIPDKVYLEKEFSICFKITNTSTQPMEIFLNLEQCLNFVWMSSGWNLGIMGSYASKSFTVSLIPLICGLQVISGIHMEDVFSKRAFRFNDITHVFVDQRETLKG